MTLIGTIVSPNWRQPDGNKASNAWFAAEEAMSVGLAYQGLSVDQCFAFVSF
jgi:hypothetical protein